MSDQPFDDQATGPAAPRPSPPAHGSGFDPSSSGDWHPAGAGEPPEEDLWHTPDSAGKAVPAPSVERDQVLPGAWHVPDTPPPSATTADYSSTAGAPGGWHVPEGVDVGDLLAGVDATIHPAPQPAEPAAEPLILTDDFPAEPAVEPETGQLILTDDFIPGQEPAPVDEETAALRGAALPGQDAAAVAAAMARRLSEEALLEPGMEPRSPDEVLSPAAIAAARVAELTGQPPAGEAIPALEAEEPTPEPQATAPLARLIAQFDNVEEQVHRLRDMYQQGVITHEALQAELRKLMILDEQGTWWMVGMETDTWYRFENGQWTQAERPRLSPPELAGEAAVLRGEPVSITLDADGMPVVHRVPREDPDATMVGASAVQFGDLPSAQATMPGRAAYPADAIPAAGRGPYQPDYEAYAPEESELYRQVQEEQARQAQSWIARLLVAGAVLTLLVVLAVIVIGILFYSGRAGQYSDRIEALADLAGQFQTTRIYDANGNLLTQINDPTGGTRISIPLEQISPFLIHATISAENERFYQDPGWDLIAIIRAAFQNVQEGEVVSGASTITQQLAKILVLEPERRTEITNARKIDEAIIAAEIGRRYSKNQILELYLNEIYYGNLAYGAEAAAQTYFGISARDLNLPQAAFLVGLVGAPATYDPVTNREAAFARMDEVIRLMLEQGCIQFEHEFDFRGAHYDRTRPFCVTQQMVDEAVVEKAEVEIRNYSVPANRARYPHFVNFVAQQLEENYGLADIYRAGFNVFTTIDPALQDIAQQAITDQLAALRAQGRGGNNASAVVMDPRDGRILAMVGSADFNNEEIDGQVNVAFTPQQPGSSIKPILYVAAFQGNAQGQYLTPASVLWDTPTCWGSYCPVNYDRAYHGPQSVRSALGNSYNIPAVKVLDFVGVDRYAQVAQAMGLTFPGSTPQQAGLPGAIGAFDVRLYDMVVAFGVLANNGRRVEPYAITAITDNAGNQVQLPPHQEPQQVIQPEHAYLVTHILADDVARGQAFGRNTHLYIPGYEVAVKTGTTDDNRDNWTVGYAPNVVVGVWHGNTDNSPMRGTSGFSGAGPIWNRIITAALQREPAQRFPIPPGIGTVEVCADSGTLPSQRCLNRRQELVAQAQLPPGPDQDIYQVARVDTLTGLLANQFCPNFTEERLFLKISDPTAFTWINNTQAGQQWAAQRNIPLPALPLPTEACNPNIQQPIIVIDWPTPNAEVQGLVEVRGRVVVYNFNRYQIEYGIGASPATFSLVDGPYTISHPNSELLGRWDVSQLPNGPYTLRLNVVTNDGGFANVDHVVIVNNPLATETPPPTPTIPPVVVTATPTIPPVIITATPPPTQTLPFVVTATPPQIVITNTPPPPVVMTELPPRDPALDIPVVYGAQASNFINSGKVADYYRFDGAAGDRIEVRAEATAGDLDTLIYLMDSFGTIIAEDDDGGTGTDSLLDFTLPAPGQYVIVITRFDVSAGFSSGEYRMTLTKLN